MSQPPSTTRQTDPHAHHAHGHAVVSAIGADRPVIVDELSRFIYDRGGNIEDSRMVNLRGQFAMMVLVGGGPPVLEKLKQDLEGFARASRLHAELRPAEAARAGGAAAGAGPASDALPYRLTGTGIDQPGLVHRVARLLREKDANIESLDTFLTAAPYTGAPMFEMDLVISVPRSTPIAQLRQALGGLCDELNVDWELAAL